MTSWLLLTAEAISINRQACVRLIGQLVLEVSVQRTDSCSLSVLLNEWRRHLPEAWKEDAQLAILQASTIAVDAKSRLTT